MNLIALDTATDVCGVALWQGGAVTVELSLARPRAHAENLLLLVQDALRYGGVGKEELGGVAVSRGPGSYTGLRIGVSAAKGLALALDLPLAGVPTLEALALPVAGAAGPDGVICAALNARRDEVYAAAFRVRDGGGVNALLETAALTAEELPGWLAPYTADRLWLAGDGAAKVEEALRLEPAFRARRLAGESLAPTAGWVARLGAERLARGEAEEAASFEPFYLKEFVAKRRERGLFTTADR